MTHKNEGRPGKGRRFGDIDHGKRSPKRYPNRPSKKSLRAARLHDRPFPKADHERAKALEAEIVITECARKLTAWRRTGE